ncbi:hypothetical protein MNEG_8624 [Monoraphidium neglectum]|jgi:hypothetical protein|uniref:Uncharacterized protein n=1 Tax=Monoraphidium neglectum TaxID=145388 RepID=A0A0D2KVC1_9CHLO|nr:hypothetical protein MNEG_8624 [Monoraphidium neglectum]KIY99338.1 hypothetical protein MNEG_8624 [Monoraphidium neglectum]|eukprot:XP_013898358.1 hypothetical protein MNEG_8624 [Monoraphidium neglectum]
MRNKTPSSEFWDYAECVVEAWDLDTGERQRILQYLTDECGEATLKDSPCADWHLDSVLRTEADCNAV